jgi:hypothetical protein
MPVLLARWDPHRILALLSSEVVEVLQRLSRNS